ncbi:ATP-binding protein [Micromonospora inositola]|uniref:Predicted ATPase n=1 Tax=Micromonospora inositola TaxID=47865 RepID=A0A1C5HU35_9ACTN|nr:helix-turn-helix domain-containing protein [Micromonospora inositola]SCG49524.1 Predicted ATPase [Micromonospora inositola]
MTPDHDRSRSPAGRTLLSDLLRGHRLAAGLTQAELAARAGVGVRTVRDLERGRSVRPQRTTVELLADALGLTHAARTTFLAAARPSPAAGSRPAGRHLPVTGPGADPSGTPIALPQPVPLIGRDRDVAEVAALLTADHPVVSLIGLAGVGKTALALAAAHAVAADHPAGVAGVLVGEGSDAVDVLAASAAVFGVNRLRDLAGRFGGRPALLLVDAVERAPDPVAEALRRLLAAAPTLRVLVTGRHPVGLRGELVRPVAPLDVPPAGTVPAGRAELDRWPAAALFTARLAQVRREPPTLAELPAVAALVRRLGGLPLAIELMAARGRILDVTELLDRYGDRVLDLATSEGRPGRDPAEGAVTLRDAVATSYRLLAPGERAALRRLSVFANRWSVELAEELLADGGDRADAVPLLDRLLELGLLSVRGTAPFRFRLLDAVRDFATEQAGREGELTRVRRRHARVVTGLVVRTAPDLVGAELAVAVHLLDEATSDITAALAHAAVDDPVTALRLAAALPRWWRFRGRDVSGRRWLHRLLADPRTADADPVLRAWALLGVAQLAAEHGAGADELPAARAALDVFRDADEVSGELSARSVLCALLHATGGHNEAREHAEAALELATRHGRVRDMAVAQNNLTWHDIRVGDLAGARRRLAAVDRLAAQCGERRLRVLARANLAEVNRLEGRYADAVEQGGRVATVLAELGDPGHRRRVLGTVGLALAQDGRAAEALEVVAELRSGTADSPVPGQRRPPRGAGVAAAGRPEDAVCALIEGNLALYQGDRELAAEWFAAAAEAGADGQDRRDVVEALVGLAASTADVTVLARLDEVRRAGGISLLPQEESLLYALVARRAADARRGAPG